MPSFNVVSLLIAACIPLIVGGFWYLPSVFGNPLASENNVTPKEKNGHPGVVYPLTYVASFMMSMLLAGILSTHAEVDKTFVHGLFHGGAASVFMAIPAFGVIALFEGKSPKYLLIHAGYWFLCMTIMGGIIGAMA